MCYHILLSPMVLCPHIHVKPICWYVQAMTLLVLIEQMIHDAAYATIITRMGNLLSTACGDGKLIT